MLEHESRLATSKLQLTVFDAACGLLAGVFIAAVIAHQLMLDDLQAYRNSFLIAVEFVGLLLLLLSLPAHGLRAIYFLTAKRFIQGGCSLLAMGLTASVAAWGIWYDAATLLYMT